MDVHVPDDETIIGGYSITSSPNQFIQSGNFKLAIQYSTHPPTEWMHTKCQVGTKIRIRVGGDFVYDPTPSLLSDLFLVAGGIGINPIFSIMKHQKDLINQSKPSRTPNNILLYSTRNCNELIFKVRNSIIRVEPLSNQLNGDHIYVNYNYYVLIRTFRKLPK